jgi:predicted HAD superfamily Cof-like phosphohydrolase
MEPRFSVNLGSKAYSDNWGAIFGPKEITPVEKSDIRKHVEEFHRAMGQPVLDTPQVPSPERARLRLGLVVEEFLELLSACHADSMAYSRSDDEFAEDILDRGLRFAMFDPRDIDLAKVADALADLDYVIEGMRLEFGINGKPIADEVHRSNMSKLGNDGKPMLRESDKKVVKGPNYSPPDIVGELIKQGMNP